jgi:hypothetical protein
VSEKEVLNVKETFERKGEGNLSFGKIYNPPIYIELQDVLYSLYIHNIFVIHLDILYM